MAVYYLEESSGGGFPRLLHPQRLTESGVCVVVVGGGGVPHLHPQRLNRKWLQLR